MAKSNAFDLADYELGRCSQDHLPVFVPKNPFRIHSDPDRTSRVLLSRFDGRHWWLTHPSIAERYRVTHLWTANLYQATLEDGLNFLLPVTEPQDSGQGWYASLNQAVCLARDEWVKITPNGGRYRIRTHASDSTPEWMEGDWPDFMAAAFLDQRIHTDQIAGELFQPKRRRVIDEEN